MIQFLGCLNPPLRFEIELVQLVFEDVRRSLLMVLHGKCVSFVMTEPSVADPENFGGWGFEAQNLKNSDVFTKIESDFSAEIGNSNVFFAQIQVVSKKKKKKEKVFTKIESNFSAEIGNSIVFFAQIQVVSKKKKKKVFTKIESDFSPDSLRLGRWGGMHPEMEPNYSKQRLIFRPKLLLLGWWGGMHPPPKSATVNLITGFLLSYPSKHVKPAVCGHWLTAY